MPSRHLLVVEGAHDAAFFGLLLARRGFEAVTNLAEVPDVWERAIPKKYPVSPDLRLERVISFPEIHIRRTDQATMGIAVANGDGALLKTLRDLLDVFDAPSFASLGVVLDTDWQQTESERFASFQRLIGRWNQDGLDDGRPGFPLAFPEQPNSVTSNGLRIGLYQFPGGGAQGSLETVLLACARHNHPVLHDHAADLVNRVVSAAYPERTNADPLKACRKPSGHAKALCGIVANVLKPGSSLAVSLRDTEWLPFAEDALPEVVQAAGFLDALLASV